MSNHSKKQKGIKIKEANLEICVNNDISNEDFDEYFQRCIHRKQEREFELSEKEYYDILENEEIDRILEEAEKWSDF